MNRLKVVALTSVALMLVLGLVPARAQEKPTLVVHAFTITSGVDFPYDVKDLQAQTIDEVNTKDGDQFRAVNDAPSNQDHTYILDGEVLEWHKGNTAERLLIAGGSVAGRENAKIHFWLTDKDGKKVLDQTDIVRQLFMRNKHMKSSGMLARPFREKIVDHLKEAKLG